MWWNINHLLVFVENTLPREKLQSVQRHNSQVYQMMAKFDWMVLLLDPFTKGPNPTTLDRGHLTRSDRKILLPSLCHKTLQLMESFDEHFELLSSLSPVMINGACSSKRAHGTGFLEYNWRPGLEASEMRWAPFFLLLIGTQARHLFDDQAGTYPQFHGTSQVQENELQGSRRWARFGANRWLSISSVNQHDKCPVLQLTTCRCRLLQKMQSGSYSMQKFLSDITRLTGFIYTT